MMSNSCYNKVKITDDLFLVLGAAVRYALGRRTYMPSAVTGYIMNECRNIIPINDIDVMIRDIDNCKDLGDKCDQETWKEFRAWLEEEKLKREPFPKDKVLQALDLCSVIPQHSKACSRCPYFARTHCMEDLNRDAALIIGKEDTAHD